MEGWGLEVLPFHIKGAENSIAQMKFNKSLLNKSLGLLSFLLVLFFVFFSSPAKTERVEEYMHLRGGMLG